MGWMMQIGPKGGMAWPCVSRIYIEPPKGIIIVVRTQLVECFVNIVYIVLLDVVKGKLKRECHQ